MTESAGDVGEDAVTLELAQNEAGRSKAMTRAEKRMMGPAGCRAHIRRTLAKEFVGIVDGFVKAAKTGSVPHVKLVTELLRPTRKARQIKGPAARFFEKLEKEKLEKERLKAQRQGVENK